MEYPYNVISKITDTMPSDDVIRAYNYAFGKLDPRKQDCLIKHYKDGLSYSRIADMYGVSQQRLTQIVIAAVKALSAYSDYLKYGYDGYSEMLRQEQLRLEKSHTYLVDYVGFTHRTRNALRRNGITDIRQIKSVSQLSNLKYIGEAVAKEVVEKVLELGVDMENIQKVKTM